MVGDWAGLGWTKSQGQSGFISVPGRKTPQAMIKVQMPNGPGYKTRMFWDLHKMALLNFFQFGGLSQDHLVTG